MTKQLQQNILLSLLVTALGATVNVFHTLADRMALSVGMDALAAGVLISVYAMGSLCSMLLSSAFADRLGKRRVVVAGLLMLALGCALLAVEGGIFTLYLGLFCFGFGFSPSEAMSSALLSDENPLKESLWMNISQAGFGIGAILGPMLTMAYIRLYPSYYGVFLICGITALAFLLLLAYTGRGRFRSGPRESAVSVNMFSVFKNRRFRFLALAIFLYLGYESVAPAYIKQAIMTAGRDEQFASLMISLFWGAMILGRLLGALLTGKEFQSIRGFTAFALAGFLLLIFARTAAPQVAAVALIGFGCGPVWPMLIALAAQQFPERTGAAVGMMMLCCMLSFTVFPPLIGTLPGSLTLTFLLCAGLAVLVILVATRALSVSRETAEG